MINSYKERVSMSYSLKDQEGAGRPLKAKKVKPCREDRCQKGLEASEVGNWVPQEVAELTPGFRKEAEEDTDRLPAQGPARQVTGRLQGAQASSTGFVRWKGNNGSFLCV